MNKTPRTDEARELDNGESCYALDLAEQLETELAEMREMFKDYVESVSELLHEDTSDACAEHHNKLHEKAKETLGL